MIFLIIRLFPIIFPISYFLAFKFLPGFSDYWFWLLLVGFISQAIFFFLLNLKTPNPKIFFLFWHAALFLAIGFGFGLLLSSKFFLNLFLAGWMAVSIIYLEAVFHFFYETPRSVLISLKNIMVYINLIIFFLAAVFLFNLYIFLNFPWWGVLTLVGLVSLILLFSKFLVDNIKLKINLFYSLAISLILLELLVGLLFLPVSFYVSAAVISLGYYLFSSLAGFSLRKKLSAGRMFQYLGFTVAALILVLATAGWS